MGGLTEDPGIFPCVGGPHIRDSHVLGYGLRMNMWKTNEYTLDIGRKRIVLVC